MRKVDVVAAGNIVEHARPGFAACAVVVGAVRTNEYGIDAAPGAGQFAPQLGVYGVKRGHAEQPPGDAGLIAGDDDAPARSRQARNSLQAARQGDPLLGAFDELDWKSTS